LSKPWKCMTTFVYPMLQSPRVCKPSDFSASHAELSLLRGSAGAAVGCCCRARTEQRCFPHILCALPPITQPGFEESLLDIPVESGLHNGDWGCLRQRPAMLHLRHHMPCSHFPMVRFLGLCTMMSGTASHKLKPHTNWNSPAGWAQTRSRRIQREWFAIFLTQ